MNHTQFKDLLSTMPSLRHSFPDQEYDPMECELVDWLSAQPGAREWIYRRMVATGRIKFDPETKTWRGVNPSTNTGGRPMDFETRQAVARIFLAWDGEELSLAELSQLMNSTGESRVARSFLHTIVKELVAEERLIRTATDPKRPTYRLNPAKPFELLAAPEQSPE